MPHADPSARNVNDPAKGMARRVSGRWVVIAMFSFGVAATGVLWTYWELHTRPFRPLQDVLAGEFPDGSPRVDGGQRKSDENTPRALRVVLRVPFDPVEDRRQAEIIAGRVHELAGRHLDVSSYDELEVRLFQPVPEAEPRIRTLREPLTAD